MSCRCGCGREPNTKNGFRRGHWNKTEVGRQLLSMTHLGIHQTEESKKKIAETLSSKRQGSANPMFGKKRSVKAIEKQRAAVTGNRHYRWNPNREEIHIKKWQRQSCYGLLHRILSRSQSPKTRKTEEMLGYNGQQLREHLETLFEPGMTLKNHGVGKGKWQIDHIRPVNTFPLDELPSVINALSNLRPLWADENIRRARKGY